MFYLDFTSETLLSLSQATKPIEYALEFNVSWKKAANTNKKGEAYSKGGG